MSNYLAPYGGTQSPFTGPEAVLPVRAYLPGGASQVGYLQVNLNGAAGTDYAIYAQSDGVGGYTLRLANATTAVPSPNLEMTASGNTITLATPITLGVLQITSYRLALLGNEFQIDLGLARSGAFSDQIVILGQSNGGAYPVPYGATVGQWSNLTVAGSTCNGASIATSIVVEDGAWQCWTASQFGTTSSPVYGAPYWNGDSGDGATTNMGWLLLGTGNYGTLELGSAPGPLGYFGLPGGGPGPKINLSRSLATPPALCAFPDRTTTSPKTVPLAVFACRPPLVSPPLHSA